MPATLDERRNALADCIEKLAPRQRQLLSHRYAAGATIKSAAAQVGQSVDAAYKALTRIREALFDCVSRRAAQERHA